jgi:hypothetical protein
VGLFMSAPCRRRGTAEGRFNLAVCAEAQMLPRGRRAVKGPADSNSRTPPPCATAYRINKTALYNIDMGKISIDEPRRRLELR